jgi:hypothetical protein
MKCIFFDNFYAANEQQTRPDELKATAAAAL